jgi:hypothetical protein
LELKNNRLNREQFSIKLTVKDIDGSKRKEYESKGSTAVEAAGKLPKAITKAEEEAAKKAEKAAEADAKKAANNDAKEAYAAKQAGKEPPKPLGPGAVDRKALMQSLSKVVGELKTKLLDEKAYGTLDLPGMGGQLADSIEYSESFDTEYSAQWLRLVGAAGGAKRDGLAQRPSGYQR